jgi:predicted nucleic acid-binding Zn ribbon protein
MPTHSEIATDPERSERAPCSTLSGGVVASSRRCPICGTPLTGRQQCCSAKCRAAKSRRERSQAQAERDRRVQALLEAAVRVLVRG